MKHLVKLATTTGAAAYLAPAALAHHESEAGVTLLHPVTANWEVVAAIALVAIVAVVNVIRSKASK